MSSDTFRAIHEGKTCVVAGNGPSLSTQLMAMIEGSGLFSFVANGFCVAFDQIDFHPGVVCMSNYDAIRRFAHLYDEGTLKFFQAGWQSVVDGNFHNVHELPFACRHDIGELESRLVQITKSAPV